MDEVLRFDTLAVHAEAGLSELNALEARLAALEGAGLPGGGAWALTFSSGSAAVDAVARLLRPGDRVIANDEPSPVTLRALSLLEEFGVFLEWRDLSDPSRWRFRNTSVVWLETPSLTGLKLVNLSAVSHRAHDAGALVVVENTVASPLVTRPLEFGADVVIHAGAGPLTGVADLGFGAVLGRDEAIRERLSAHRQDLRIQPGALEVAVAGAGLASLPVRHERQCASALDLARRLRTHASIKDVYYPGLEMHRGHSVATRQMVARDGREQFGAVISLRFPEARTFEPRLFAASNEVGGSRSLISELEPGLFRLSVGLEDPADLWADLERAISAPVVVAPVEVIEPEAVETLPTEPEPISVVPEEPQGPARPFAPAAGNPTAGLGPLELERYVRLREARDAQAASLELSRFVIASNALLAAIARANPSSIAGLDGVPGMDAERLEKYGPMLLAALRGEPSPTPEPSAPIPEPKPAAPVLVGSTPARQGRGRRRAPEGPARPSSPKHQPAAKPVSASVMLEPVSEPVPPEPVSEPVPPEPVSEPVPPEPVSGPVQREPISEAAPLESGLSEAIAESRPLETHEPSPTSEPTSEAGSKKKAAPRRRKAVKAE